MAKAKQEKQYKIKVEFEINGKKIGHVFVVSDIMLEQYKVSEVLIKEYIEQSILKTIETLLIQGARSL
jgi:hypothetical protein